MMQDFTSMVEESIRRGQQAQGILGTPVIAKFFERAMNHYIGQTLTIDPENLVLLRANALAFQATKRLHDELTQAVADGLTATERLVEQAKEGAGR